jgi:hypothetical protein
MVPNAKGQVIEVEAPIFVLGEPVHEAERTSRRWDIDLHTARKTGAVPRILVADEEGIHSLPFALQARADFFTDATGALARLSKVVLPSQLIKGHWRKAPLEGHDSVLAIWGLHCPVGGLKLVQRCGLVAQALHDRLGGGIGGDKETTVCAGLLNHVGTLEIAAELDVRLLHWRNHGRERGLSLAIGGQMTEMLVELLQRHALSV